MNLDELVSDEAVLEVLGKAYRGEYSHKGYRSEEVERVRSELEKRLKERTVGEIARSFLSSVGINHLDQIGYNNVPGKTRFWSLLGIENDGRKYYKIEKVQAWFDKNGIFSPRLRDYENHADIIKWIVSRIQGKFNSYYFGNSLAPDVLKDNRALLFEHDEYLKNIKHLDEIECKPKSGLWSLLGIETKRKRHTLEEIQRGFVNLGRFRPRLREVANHKEILKWIIDKKLRVGSGKFHSFYFSRSLDPDVLKDNRDLLFENNLYLSSIKHLDFISYKAPIKKGLWSLLGIDRKEENHTIEEVQKGFVKIGRFSEDLRTYSSAERDLIFSDLLEKRAPSSYYLVSSHEYVESNRRLFFASEQFQEYLEREGISLVGLSTVKTQGARSVFREYLGINVGAVAGIEGTIIGTRKITSVWSKDEEARLLDNYIGIAGSLENGAAIKALQEVKDDLQETFGRSIHAILMKLQHLGAIEYRTFDEPTGEPSEVILYPFPQFHERDLKGFSLRTKNSAYLLELGMVPDATMVASYLSPTEQLVHATLPIHYKGIELTNYNETEQRLLGLVNTYIKHSDRFGDTNKKSLELLADTELDRDIRILAVANEDNVYAQIMHRINGEIPEETAISTGKESEIYFFKREETPTYEEARRRPVNSN